MPGFHIDYLSGERAGAIDTFDKDVVRVGRAPEFELIFDEMGVSWEHAEIRKRDGDFWVVDRGSTNGTYVNDERAHNARLRDGDVLKFGKKGPVLRFRRVAAPASGRFGAVPAAGPPPPAAGVGFPAVDPIVPVNSVEPPAPSQQPPAVVRRPTRRLSEPVMAALPPPPRDEVLLEARSDLPPAAPRRTGPSPWALAATLSLGVLALAGGGTAGLLYMEMRQQDQALVKERDRRAELEREVKAARAEFEEQLVAARRGRSDAEAETTRQQAELERVKRRGEEEAQRLGVRVTELERDLEQARGLLQRISREERPGPRPTQPQPTGPAVAGDWKAIDRRLSQSVVFIATQLEGRKPDGTTIPMHGFGTGFFASASGHIVTNKHVIEPWKFREMAERMAVDGIEIVEGSYQIHVWIAGTRFLRDRNMDLSTGYSTATKTLEVVRTAPDRWEQVQLGGPKGPRSIRYHNDNCNEDLAILRAHVQTPVTPAPMGTSDSVERLDEVMVLGFPAGPMILEAGVAETSPATGQVRKIEQTIFVSAAMIGGNSGGPLIDRHGRVVGISTRVANGTETLGSCLRIEHATSLLQGGAW